MTAVDQTLIGSNSTNGSTVTTVTTSSAAVAGSKIWALVSWFNSNAVTMTVAGGGLSWSSLKQVNNGNDRYAIWCADAPAGLASSTAISVTQSSSGAGGLLADLASFTGLPTGTVADATNQATGTGASWSSGSASNLAAGALAIGGAGNETATTTSSTPTAGTELLDRWETLAGQGIATGYIIAAAVAAQVITGSWVGAASTANTGAIVVFPGTSTDIPYVPHRMPLGV